MAVYRNSDDPNMKYSYCRSIDRYDGKRIFLSKEELYRIEKEDTDIISKALRTKKPLTVKEDRILAKVIAISWFCFGGNMPVHFQTKGLTFTNQEEKKLYTYQFKLRIISRLTYFYREKGCWTNHVRYAKGHAIDDVIRFRKTTKNYNNKIENYTAFVRANETINNKYNYKKTNWSDNM